MTLTERMIRHVEKSLMQLNAYTPSNKAEPRLTPDMIEFRNLINNILTYQSGLSSEEILRQGIQLGLDRRDFLYYINTHVNEFMDTQFDSVDDLVKNIYDKGKQAGYTQLKVQPYMSGADTHALFRLTRYNFDLVTNLTKDLQSDIRNHVWRGISTDQSNRTIAQRIQNSPNLKPLQTSNRTISIAERAEMIARTETMRARNQGLEMSFREYGIDWWDTSLGAKPCPICQDIHSKGPYHIDDPDKPPYHPRCECVMVPADEPSSKAKTPKRYTDLVDNENVKYKTQIKVIT